LYYIDAMRNQGQKREGEKMKTKKLIIDGKAIETTLYRTLGAAQNYIKKHSGFELVYFRAHEYYVGIK